MTNDEFRATLPEWSHDYFDRMVDAEFDGEPVLLMEANRCEPDARCHTYARICEHLGVSYRWADGEDIMDAVFRFAREAGFEVTPSGLGEFIGGN